MQAGGLFLVDNDLVQVAQEREPYLCYVLGRMINNFPGRQGARFFLFTVFLGLVAVNSVVGKTTWKQPFPAEVAALAPSGMIIDQTFRYWSYDPTNCGLASSYLQLLIGRNPEIGGAYNLDIRKYRDLTRFRYQSRIIRVTPVGAKTLR
jgi:hypothetical protein